MTPDEYFSSALEKPRGLERESFLDECCGVDTPLRKEVESLLKAHDDAGSFLANPIIDPISAVAGDDKELTEKLIGTSIGPYRLTQTIGQGGMGIVFVAEQAEPVRRKVAIKLIKSPFASRSVVARFDAERHALAIMDHPSIARVIDGGTTEQGYPYFVMELVKGLSITEYCDRGRLSPRQRLELMIPVCHAVQHAHQKGIIHRDLKPSNVLVTEYDGHPVPKIIDFGIAKAVDIQLTDMTLNTDFGAVVGTLEYMSPEQAGLNQLDIDTRSDVYSLGVLLYELLTGSTPFNRSQLGEAAILEALRLIREVDPERPSTRISSVEQAPSIAANRSTEPANLTGIVRGDLDWIAMKALEKDRSRRYQTANELAQEIERFLANEPVLAGPPSRRYRLRKFLKRNRTAASFASLLLLALIGGSIGTTLGMFRARAERNQKELALHDVERERDQKAAALAAEEQARAEADNATDRAVEALQILTDDVTQRLMEAQPELTPANREFLNDIISQLEQFTNTTANNYKARVVQADGLNQIGVLRTRLGDYSGAIEALRKSIDIWEPLCREYPDKPHYKRGMGDAWSNLGIGLACKQEFEDSESALRKAIDIHQSLADSFPDNKSFRKNVANCRNSLGVMLKDLNRNTETVEQYELAKAAYQRILDDDPQDEETLIDLCNVNNNLTIELFLAGRIDESLTVGEEVVLARQKLVERPDAAPRDAYVLATSMMNLARIYGATNRLDEATSWFEKAEPFAARAVAESPGVVEYREGFANLLDSLATCYSRNSQNTACAKACDRSIALLENLLREFPERASFAAQIGKLRYTQALAWMGEQKADSARDALESGLRAYRKAIEREPDNDQHRNMLANLHLKFAELADQLEDPELKKQHQHEARKILNEMLTRDPENPLYRKLFDTLPQNH